MNDDPKIPQSEIDRQGENGEAGPGPGTSGDGAVVAQQDIPQSEIDRNAPDTGGAN